MRAVWRTISHTVSCQLATANVYRGYTGCLEQVNIDCTKRSSAVQCINPGSPPSRCQIAPASNPVSSLPAVLPALLRPLSPSFRLVCSAPLPWIPAQLSSSPVSRLGSAPRSTDSLLGSAPAFPLLGTTSHQPGPALPVTPSAQLFPGSHPRNKLSSFLITPVSLPPCVLHLGPPIHATTELIILIHYYH